jgi:hypothetical protein
MHKRLPLSALLATLVSLVTLAALSLAAAAAAATAPTASTGPVTATAPTTATVSGSVNPSGTATTWVVEYGTSTTYGSKTASVSAGAGTASVAVSASLASLKPGTTYHYRFVATSTAGTGHGADGILTTSSVPAAVTSSATSVTPTSATLNGTVDPSGRPTTWTIEYGTSTSYGTKTPAKDAGSGTGAAAVSAAVTGLTIGRTYHFRVVATSDAGTSRGADKTFVSSTAPAVTTKAASSVADTTARLNGSVNPNGQATTYYFEYGTSTSYGTKTAAASAGAGTSAKSVSAAVSGLVPGAVYHFRLVATNASGTTLGADLAFATSGKPVVQTAAPTAVTGTSATLTGTVDRSGHATTFYFEFGTTTGYGTKTATQNASASAGPHAVSVPIAALAPGLTYHVRLVATSSAGAGYGADMTFTTLGPAVTLSLSSATVTYGRRVVLHGAVSSKQANASVGVFASRNGGSFTAVATVLTGAGGTWSLSVKPVIRTAYKALFAGGSMVKTVAVRPGVTLRTPSRGQFATHVAGIHSFKGRVVQLQRHRLNGSWLTVARTKLRSGSTAVFHPSLPFGRSVLRVTITAAQAGSGYLAGYSAGLSYRRR